MPQPHRPAVEQERRPDVSRYTCSKATAHSSAQPRAHLMADVSPRQGEASTCGGAISVRCIRGLKYRVGRPGGGAEPTPAHTQRMFVGNYVILLRYMSGCRGAVCRISCLVVVPTRRLPVGGPRTPSRGYTQHRETIHPWARAMC